MPYADKSKQKDWYKKKMAQGYGKALYRTRKRHIDNEAVLRKAVTDAFVALNDDNDPKRAEAILADALIDAPAVVRGATIQIFEDEVVNDGET